MEVMLLTHGLHAHSGLLNSADQSILHCNNKKKRGNARDRRAFLKEMTPMAYAPVALATQDLALPRSESRSGKGFFARLLAAMMVSRQRDAEREIARYVAGSGGKFTDETEREIERRFLSRSNW